MPTNHSWHRKQCWLLLPSLPTLEARQAKDTELKRQLCAIWRHSVSSAWLFGSKGRTIELLLKVSEKDNEHVSGVRSISTSPPAPTHWSPYAVLLPLLRASHVLVPFVTSLASGNCEMSWFYSLGNVGLPQGWESYGETIKSSRRECQAARNGKAITAGLDVGPNGKKLLHRNCKLLSFAVHCWFTFHDSAEQTPPRCLYNPVSSAI